MSETNIGSVNTHLSGRKRKADSLGRLAETTTASKQSKSGRGSLAGWTTCPLCGRHSQKRYALGRGIASHLHAVHTPWNPGKVELKKRRRIEERRRAEMKRQQGEYDTESQDTDTSPIIEIWEPTQEEIDAWDEKVLQIVSELDKQAQREDGESKDDGVKVLRSGLDRTGKETKAYRDSLPSFIQAAADGNLDTLEKLVKDAKSTSDDAVEKLLDSRDRHLSTAEHWAAGGGHLSCLRYLLKLRREHGMQPLENDKKMRRRDGKSCLHYAARNGRIECLRYLIEEEAYTIDEPSGDGTTPFHMACFGGHLAAVEYLMSRDANVHATNEWGCNAAHWIAMTRNESQDEARGICRLLQEAGVSFMEQQKQGHSALHKAAQRRNRHVVEWLFQPTQDGGAGLSAEELRLAGRPDAGGHSPSDIWLGVGGEETFARYMEEMLK